MHTKFWLYFFLVCSGFVLSAMLLELTAGVDGLAWLAYGRNFGTETPVNFNLGFLCLTLGLNIRFTISTILCVALMLILGKVIEAPPKKQ